MGFVGKPWERVQSHWEDQEMAICIFWLVKWVFHPLVPTKQLEWMSCWWIRVMGQAGFTSPPIMNIHGVKMIPIPDFVAFEQIDLCRWEIFLLDINVYM